MIKFLIFLCINVGVFGTPIEDPSEDDSTHVLDRMPTPDIVKYFGYPIEIHTVTTEDGYILELHRIPHGLGRNPEENKAVVYLQHPLFASSAEFVYTTPEKGLGFILADNGFDVWMPNSRGNTYSRKHTSLDPDKDREFWNFSWHEMGVSDIPAALDYILAETGAPDVLYIGHSQGTTQGFVAGARIENLEEKIRGFFMLAPTAHIEHATTPLLKFFAPPQAAGTIASKVVGFQEFFPDDSFESFALQTFCNTLPGVSQEICSSAIFLGFGYDQEQFNETLLSRITSHSPCGVSTKQLIHYSQLVHNPNFQEFDNGPIYDLGKIKVPTYLYSGQNDWIVDLVDLEKTKSELGNLKQDYRVPFDKFNHGDFLFANDVVTLLYDKLIEDLNRVAAGDKEEMVAEGNDSEGDILDIEE